MKSNCCQSKVYVVGGHMRIDADNIDKYDVQRGKTYWYECDKCKQACDKLIKQYSGE